MKPTLLVLPVASLVLVASWIGSERNSISALENESTVLKSALAARASGLEVDTAAPKVKSADQLAKEKAPIDWKKIAAQMAEMRSGGDMRAYFQLQKKLRALSKEELISALDEIVTLDLPSESVQMLQQMLLAPLCEDYPEYALIHYYDQISDVGGMMNSQLARAMKNWAGKDPAAATAWFDQQIAAGKFDSKSLDGKSQARMQLEGSLIRALIATAPAAAALRLKSLPEDQRAGALQSHQGGIEDKNQLAYANLVRSGLPQEAQVETFKQEVSNIIRRGEYTEVSEYMDRIKATPAERSACIQLAAEQKIERLSWNRKVTRGDIDTMRDWVVSQAPSTTEKVTGLALAKSTRGSNKMEFSEAAALATQYHKASGNDELLISFLADCEAEPRYKEEAAVLAAKISDVKKREEILSRFK